MAKPTDLLKVMNRCRLGMDADRATDWREVPVCALRLDRRCCCLSVGLVVEIVDVEEVVGMSCAFSGLLLLSLSFSASPMIVLVDIRPRPRIRHKFESDME